jgi:hypothetical protein
VWRWNCSIPLAMVAALAVASACGLLNGLLVARAGMTPVLATLGGRLGSTPGLYVCDYRRDRQSRRRSWRLSATVRRPAFPFR